MANHLAAIILGKQWKDEDDLTKADFKLMADSIKKKHFLDHPEYQYQPRKPTEKKRRMTRRKAEALSMSAGGNLGVYTDVNSNVEANPEPENDYITLPEFDTTLGGNIVFDMGDEGLEDENLFAMLEGFNDTIPSDNSPTRATTSTALFTEPTEQGQSDFNFYSNMVDFENSNPTNHEFDYEYDAIVNRSINEVVHMEEQWAMMDPTKQGKVYDAQQASLSNAELQRTAAGF